MSTEKEELERALIELNRMKEERRHADEVWRHGVDKANKEQSAALQKIILCNERTSSEITEIRKELNINNARMNKQDKLHETTVLEQIETDARIKKLELYNKSQRKLIRWLVGILTTLGLGIAGTYVDKWFSKH
jgi:phosphate starvation-inducible protein PhoH